jgi:SnoaL-like protein
MSEKIVIAGLHTRLERLETESAIRNIMARYMNLCDRLDESAPMDELAALFARDAVWTGKGRRYQAAFGEHRGRAAIAEMLGAYRGPPPHFALNAHFLTSESINATSVPAVGTWLMLQASTYDGTSDLRCARLNVQFAFEDARWRISRFETENIFARPMNRWNDQADPSPPESSARGE